MKKFSVVIISIFLIGQISCSSDDQLINDKSSEIVPAEVDVKLGIDLESYGGVKTKAIYDEIKYITLLLFDTTTQEFNRQISFDVVGTEYMFKIPTGSWTVVLVGTGDGLIANFATPLLSGTTLLTDKMLKVDSNADVYSNTREYFYDKQNVIITTSSSSIPAMLLRRIVSKFTVSTTSQFSDSLSYFNVSLTNAIESINYSGDQNATYITQFQQQSSPINGIYNLEFYTFGTKPLGPNANEFYINIGYKRKSVDAIKYFKIYDSTDLQEEGLVVNTKTSLTIGI